MGTLDKKSEQVYLWMRSYIDENKFVNNPKLPSENVISHRLSVSRETVRTALARLVEEGLVRKVKGSGTYINKEVDKGVRRKWGRDQSRIDTPRTGYQR